MLKIIKFLFGIFAISYWSQHDKYNKELDKWFDEILKSNPKIEINSIFHCSINGILFWIENHPYDSFYFYGNRCGVPSRYNRYRMMKLIRILQFECNINETKRITKMLLYPPVKP